MLFGIKSYQLSETTYVLWVPHVPRWIVEDFCWHLSEALGVSGDPMATPEDLVNNGMDMDGP